MFTESDAWDFLGELWKNPRILENCYTHVTLKHGTCSGLCRCIKILLLMNKINIDTYGWMISKIPALRPFSGHCWPTNEDGAKQRVNFCKKMSKKEIPQ